MPHYLLADKFSNYPEHHACATIEAVPSIGTLIDGRVRVYGCEKKEVTYYQTLYFGVWIFFFDRNYSDIFDMP